MKAAGARGAQAHVVLPGQNQNLGTAEARHLVRGKSCLTWRDPLEGPASHTSFPFKPWALAARGTHRHTLALGESM